MGFFKNSKDKIKRRLARNKLTGRLVEEYDFRTVVFAIFSFALSFAYVLFNGVIGILEKSIWYGSLATYYLVLALMRGGILIFHSKKRREGILDENKLKGDQLKTYRATGCFLIVLPFCLSAAIAQMVLGNNSFEHAGLTIYAAATYAFYKIIMAIYNFFKARKFNDFTISAIRNINLADALVSILALQTAMFKEFSPLEDVSFANALTGTGVCLLTLALGTYMIIIAQKKLKENKDER